MSFFDYSDSVDAPIFFDYCDSYGKNQVFKNTITKHHQYMNHAEPPQRRIKWNIYETESGNLMMKKKLAAVLEELRRLKAISDEQYIVIKKDNDNDSDN